VVNHHLLLYDLLSDFSLLPFHRQLIIDEAPDIEDVISAVLGSALTYERTTWLLHRLRGLKVVVDHLFPRVESFFKKGDAPLSPVCPIPDPVIEKLKKLRADLALDTTVTALEKRKRSTEDEELRDRIETTIGYIGSFARTWTTSSTGETRTRCTISDRGEGPGTEEQPCRVGSAFAGLLRGYKGVVMTSATMTSGGTFAFLKQRLKIVDWRKRIIGSPLTTIGRPSSTSIGTCRGRQRGERVLPGRGAPGDRAAHRGVPRQGPGPLHLVPPPRFRRRAHSDPLPSDARGRCRRRN
jgi:Rad3-related DNA helicase